LPVYFQFGKLLVNEMLHLLEPTHNARFVALMDRFMPHGAFLPRGIEPAASSARELGLLKPTSDL